MFALFLGRRGSGKSYEMVRYHVLPTIASGRMVVTNLKLNIEQIYAVYPEARGLLVELKPTKLNPVPFSTLPDYIHEWRHPETNQGPLILIDEAHKALPKGRASRDVLEFLAESRHAGVDLYVATQGIRKLDADLVDMIDMTYRFIKARAFGSSSHYIRKVIDGTRGETFNTTPRKYDSAYFKFYQSHTKSDKAVQEVEDDSDIIPIWKRWPFIGAAMCFIFVVGMISFGFGNPFAGVQAAADAGKALEVKTDQSHPEPPPMQTQFAINELPTTAQTIQPVEPEKPKEIDHPYSRVKLHVAGDVERNGNRNILFKASQNGQQVFYLYSEDLKNAGYGVEYISSCSVALSYGAYTETLLCDLPTVSMSVATSNMSN